MFEFGVGAKIVLIVGAIALVVSAPVWWPVKRLTEVMGGRRYAAHRRRGLARIPWYARDYPGAIEKIRPGQK